jgi:hypothetical protein
LNGLEEPPRANTTQDAIEYHSKEIKFLRDKIDAKRQSIDSLIKRQRDARKGRAEKVQGENYGE